MEREMQTRGSAFWKRLELSWEGSEGAFLGEKNLEAKYQNTAIRMIPVMLWPNPPPLPCCCPPWTWPSAAAATGGAIFFFSFFSFSVGGLGFGEEREIGEIEVEAWRSVREIFVVVYYLMIYRKSRNGNSALANL